MKKKKKKRLQMRWNLNNMDKENKVMKTQTLKTCNLFFPLEIFLHSVDVGCIDIQKVPSNENNNKINSFPTLEKCSRH